MATLIDRLKAASKVEGVSILTDSKFFTKKDMIQTPVPMINVALSGSLDGGLIPGHTMLAGPSKHFKTSFALLMASAYLKQYKDAVLLFYDTEFGSPQAYFESFGIDTDRVLHTPITNIETLKFDMAHQLDNLTRGEKVIIIIDSIGNIASKKEVEDALGENTAADMTRAKQLKSLFRIVSPHLPMKDIPMLTINHTYKEQKMHPRDIVSGGTGAYYSADNIWIIGRQQDKVGTEIQGYHFIINVEKSRFVREKSKIPISVSWEGGIEKWSGLLDVALETGHVIKPKNGWYMPIDPVTKKELAPSNCRAADTMKSEFWKPIMDTTNFADEIRKKFTVAHSPIMEEVTP
jgi:hypothetical protein